MIYGRKKVEDLVSRMILIPPEREAALELVYALPYPELPPTLAEIIVQNPHMVLQDNPFPANLAFALVDTGLEYREESKRHERYRHVFRQFNAVNFELEQREFPCSFVPVISSRFWLLSTGAQAVRDLASEESLPGSVRATLSEQLLLALSGCRELMMLLLQHLSQTWSETKKSGTIRLIVKTTEEALHNDPILEHELVLPASGPARFFRPNLENSSFRQEAERVCDSLVAGFSSTMKSLAPALH